MRGIWVDGLSFLILPNLKLIQDGTDICATNIICDMQAEQYPVFSVHSVKVYLSVS